MLFALLVLAQETAKTDSGAPQGNFSNFLFPILMITFLFYFLMVRPATRENKQRQALINSLKKNDDVVIMGGIIGTVVSIKDKKDEVVVKVDDNSNIRLRVTRSSIVRILKAEEEEAAKDAKPSES